MKIQSGLHNKKVICCKEQHFINHSHYVLAKIWRFFDYENVVKYKPLKYKPSFSKQTMFGRILKWGVYM